MKKLLKTTILLLLFISFPKAWTYLSKPKINVTVTAYAWCKDCAGASNSVSVLYSDGTTYSRSCSFSEYVSWQGKSCSQTGTSSSTKAVVAWESSCNWRGSAGQAPEYGCNNAGISGGTEVGSYYLDVNSLLDGANNGDISGFGTFSIKIDGVVKGTDLTDFYQKINYGSKYEIYDIKATTGYTYNGVTEGSLTGTMGTSNVGVRLKFTTNYNAYQMGVLYDGNKIVQNTDTITSGKNYTIKTIKFCKKTTDTTNYTIGVGKNFESLGTQTGTSGCTIVK